jgi:hypothetical protein
MARIADFTTGTYTGITPANVSASGGYAQTVAGALTSFAANLLRRTDKGLLIEPAATNLVLQSPGNNASPWANFTNGTGTQSVILNNGVAPDGTTTATKVSINRSTGDWAIIKQNFTGLSGTYQPGIWLKAFAAGDVGKTIILVLHSGSTIPGTTITLPAAWTLFTAAGQSAPTELFLGYSDAGWGASGTGAVSFLTWTAQVEAGTVASSPIPTTTTALTRSADAVSFTIPTGCTVLTFTFDDASTSTATVTPGATYTIPTSLSRPYIKFIDSNAASGSVGTATGTSTANAVATSSTASVASSSGTSTATGVTAKALSSAATATGTSTASATGRSALSAVATATGTSTANAVGATAATGSTGTASGTSSASGVAALLAASTGTAIGSSTASCATNITASSVATATGTSTANAVSPTTSASIGTASGASTATGIAPTISSAVGTATGTSTANAVSNAASGFDTHDPGAYQRFKKHRQQVEKDELARRQAREDDSSALRDTIVGLVLPPKPLAPVAPVTALPATQKPSRPILTVTKAPSEHEDDEEEMILMMDHESRSALMTRLLDLAA